MSDAEEYIGSRISSIISAVSELVLALVDEDKFGDFQYNSVTESDTGNHFRAYYGIEKISEQEAEKLKRGTE